MPEVSYTTEPIPIEKLPIDIPGIGANLHSLAAQPFLARILMSKTEKLLYDCLKTLVFNSQLLALEKINLMLLHKYNDPDALLLAGLIKLFNNDLAGALEALMAARPTNRAGGEYFNKWLPQFRLILRLNFTYLAVLYPNAFGREIAIAICQWALQDRLAAIDTLINCRKYISTSPESLLPLIEIYLELGDIDKAFQLCRRDIPSFRDNLDFEIYAIEGRIQFFRKQYHESIRIFNALIKARKGRNPWLITRVRYGLAMSYYNLGELASALKALKEINPYYLPGPLMKQKVSNLISEWQQILQDSDNENNLELYPSFRSLEINTLETPTNEEKLETDNAKPQYFVTNPVTQESLTQEVTNEITGELPITAGLAGFDLQGTREPLNRFQTVGEKRAIVVEPLIWAFFCLIILFIFWIISK